MAVNGGPETWDPELMGKVVPNPKAQARIMRDITDILQSPIEGIWLVFAFFFMFFFLLTYATNFQLFYSMSWNESDITTVAV